MATYAGYVRREGKDQPDLGTAFSDAAKKIGLAYTTEKKRREDLTNIARKRLTDLDGLERHSNPGVNNFLQKSISTIKTQIYDEWENVKGRDISENDYREKLGNLSSSWNKFSLMAKNWNDDSIKLIEGLQPGEDGKPLYSKLTGKNLQRRDSLAGSGYNNTQAVMDKNGNIVFAKIVTDEMLSDDENLALEGYKAGDVIEGSYLPANGLVDPQNLVSNYFDAPEIFTNATKNVEAYETILGEDGEWITDDITQKEEFVNIVNNTIAMIDSNPETFANSMTAMYPRHEYFDSEAERVGLINDYMTSGQSKSQIYTLSRTIHAENPKLTPEEAVKKAAEKVYGDALMHQVAQSLTEAGIFSPSFEEEDANFKADQDGHIQYLKYDEYTGDITTEDKYFKKWEIVDVGLYQKENQKAIIARNIKTYAGRSLKDNPNAIDAKLRYLEYKKDQRAGSGSGKDPIPNYYKTSMEVVKGNKKAVSTLKEALKRNNSKIESIELVEEAAKDKDGNPLKDNNGNPLKKKALQVIAVTDEGYLEVINQVDYIYDDEGVLDEEATAKVINQLTHGGDPTKAEEAFEKSKQAYPDTELDEGATQTYEEEKEWHDLSKDPTEIHAVPKREDGDIKKFKKGDKKGQPITEEKTSNQIIEDIATDKDDDVEILTTQYLEDVAGIPSGSFRVDFSREGDLSELWLKKVTIDVLKRGGDAKARLENGKLRDWKTYSFESDFSGSDTDLATYMQEIARTLTKANRYYYTGENTENTKPSFEEWQKANPKGTYPDYLESIK